MPHSEITVTMSLKEYESMKAEIHSLREKQIGRFVQTMYENDDIFSRNTAYILNNSKLQGHYEHNYGQKVYLPGEEINYEV